MSGDAPGPRRARGYSPLSWSEASVAVLRGVLQHLAEETSAGRAPVAGFDLDGCLFDTRPRQVHIFRELASQRDLDALYRVGPEHFRDWSLDATMQRAGLDPDWITAHSDEVRRFWFERFFHDDYMTLDHALPGGPGFVRACRDAGALIVYLTGRDIKMRAGTETALRRFGFPYDHDRALLITKPHFDMDDTLFKESALERIATLGNVATYFDNEPANVNLFHARHPEARVVFVETDHSPKPIEPDPDIPWIQSFLLG